MEDDLNYLVLLEAESNIVEYYYGALWSGESDKKNGIEDFRNYINKTSEELNNPLVVRSN